MFIQQAKLLHGKFVYIKFALHHAKKYCYVIVLQLFASTTTFHLIMTFVGQLYVLVL